MPTLQIEIPEQTLDHLNMSPSEFAVTMRAMTALKMYAEPDILPGGG